MKIIKFFSATFLFLTASLCYGQDKQVMHIDSVCYDINNQIEQGVVMPHTISYIVNRPAIGIQKTTIEFYYNALSCENWDYDPATDSVSYIRHPELMKVVMSYNIAAAEFVKKTYFYEKEKLVFFESVVHSEYNAGNTDSLHVYYISTDERKFDKYVNGTPTGIIPDAKEKKYIDEAGPANFFAIKGNKYITPDSKSILPSITNMSLMELAKDIGMIVERRRVSAEELTEFDEVGACGTAAVITPIKKIFDREIGNTFEFCKDGKAGPVSTKLYQRLQGIQYGEVEDKFGWNYIVE